MKLWYINEVYLNVNAFYKECSTQIIEISFCVILCHYYGDPPWRRKLKIYKSYFEIVLEYRQPESRIYFSVSRLLQRMFCFDIPSNSGGSREPGVPRKNISSKKTLKKIHALFVESYCFGENHVLILKMLEIFFDQHNFAKICFLAVYSLFILF